MKKLLVLTASVILVALATLIAPPVSANPYKVVWQRCGEGSEVDWVIRCRLVGGEDCYANWQGFCDEPASLD
jgi:hypothetical protein